MKTAGGPSRAVVAAVAAVWLVPLRTSAVASASDLRLGSHGSKGYGYAGHESIRVLQWRPGDDHATAGAERRPRATQPPGSASEGRALVPKGETMWLQAGLAALPETPVMLYARSHARATTPCSSRSRQNVAVGVGHRLAVLEMSGRPGVWRVWLNGQPATEPIVLEGSHRLWKPIATAETWNGGVRRLQPVRLPLRPSRRRPVARRLVAAVRARLHVPRPRQRRPSAAARLRPADARVGSPRAVRVRRRLLVEARPPRS